MESFLRTDKAPPGTPEEHIEEAKQTTFFASKKFFTIFTSVVLLMSFFGLSIFIMFLTSAFPELIWPFVEIFRETINIFAIIIGVYLSLQTSVDIAVKFRSPTTIITPPVIVKVDEKEDEEITIVKTHVPHK